jgi:Brp/Blh family beta-carotene 15,15'-monooxygenase
VGGVHGAATLAAILLLLAGAPLAGAPVTAAACLAILLLGLPHGALDIELLKREHALSSRRVLAVLALYIGLAGGMAALWRADPSAALLAFVLVSVLHFSEDWREAGAGLPALGLGAAVLAGPTLRHHAEVAEIFALIASQDRARVVADLLLLIAPVSLALAAVGAVLLHCAGRRATAIGAAWALAGAVLLPPAVSFVLFFGLLHSPHHFKEGLAALSWGRFGQWSRIVLPLTAAAGGIAALTPALLPEADMNTQLLRASFVTLSLLVVPHMAVPLVLSALRRAAERSRPTVAPSHP